MSRDAHACKLTMHFPTLDNLPRSLFILVTGESQISRLSGGVHTPVWPQAFMGPVGHYDHPCTQDAP